MRYLLGPKLPSHSAIAKDSNVVKTVTADGRVITAIYEPTTLTQYTWLKHTIIITTSDDHGHKTHPSFGYLILYGGLLGRELLMCRSMVLQRRRQYKMVIVSEGLL